MKNLQILIAAVFFSLCSSSTYGQKFDPLKMEAIVHTSIEKAYAASVRIWGFDVDKQMRTSGQFSGVVVSAEGHILTAAHVNVPGNTYKIMFPDGASKIARGLGEIELESNRSLPDVAMMKITDSGKWPYAEIGWSYSLKKDEPCISIAYPETLNQNLPTIRFGYVAEVQNKYGFIRSTCLMEPGDSGGPLFDCYGRVIGLHSAIDASEKDNFEVPIDLYRKYWTALNEQQTYKTFPSVKDEIGVDPLAAQIISIPALETLDVNFNKVTAKLKGGVCLIKSDVGGKLEKTQGILFQSDGFLLMDSLKNRSFFVSKSSLVGNNPVIETEAGQIPATIINRDKDNDLVLLASSVNLKGGINLAQFKRDTLQFNELGKFLISRLSDGTYKMSIVGSSEFNLPKMTNGGYLGAAIGIKDNHFVLTAINPNSPASEGKLEAGDQILDFNGVPINNPNDFFNIYQQFWPGDKISIKVNRHDSNLSKDTTLLTNVTLGVVPETHFNHPAENFVGGKSIRKDGFKHVFAHDAVLVPEQCGGPVFDVNGHFYGINIARYSRTTMLTIPGKDILRFIKSSTSAR